MNRWQKISWFNLFTMITGFAVGAIVASRLPSEQLKTPPNLLTVVCIVALVLVAMSSKVIFPKKSGQIDSDERDKLIHKKATLAGWIAFAMSLLLLLMGSFYVVGPGGTLSAFTLPLIGVIGGGICVIVASVATPLQYGREPKDVQD